MRAAFVTTPGTPDAIEFDDLPDPEPQPGEVVIAVGAATVNPVDLQTRSGVYHSLGWVTKARVGLGWDVAGTVVTVGDGVDPARIGEHVAALIGGVDRMHGAYAERVAVPSADAATVPAALSLTDAATIPLNATTAAQALDLLGGVGDRSLLVTGAGGAVGGYALELAARRGFRVTGLARIRDEEFVRSTGAAFVAHLPETAAFDAVLDTAALGDPALTAVVDGGDYVGVIPIAVPASTRVIRTQAVMASPDGALLDALMSAAARGELTPRVQRVLPLTDAAEAHRLVEAGGVRGRIVLVP